jgi:hypothetical protein
MWHESLIWYENNILNWWCGKKVVRGGQLSKVSLTCVCICILLRLRYTPFIQIQAIIQFLKFYFFKKKIHKITHFKNYPYQHPKFSS